MTAALRWLLLRLAHWHMVAAFALMLYEVSPYAIWACEGKQEVFCVRHISVWKLQKVYPDTIAYTVEALLLLTAAINFSSCVLGFARVYKEIVAGLDAVSFVIGIVPWALVLGYSEQAKGKPGIAMFVAILTSFLHMLAACLALVAILMPDEAGTFLSNNIEPLKDDEAKLQPLLAEAILPDPVPQYSLKLLEVASYSAFGTAILALAALGDLNIDGDLTALGAQGCQLAVLLLAADVAGVSYMVSRKAVNTGMGSIVASSLSLVGWITGIVGCSLITTSAGSFTTAATYSLLSLLFSVVTFSVGIYIGVHH